jgi:hypothetical protein
MHEMYIGGSQFKAILGKKYKTLSKNKAKRSWGMVEMVEYLYKTTSSKPQYCQKKSMVRTSIKRWLLPKTISQNYT